MDYVVEIKVPRRFGRRYQGFAFDMYCWCLFSEYTQLGFNEFGMLEDNKFMQKIMYCAAVSFNKSKGKRVGFVEKDVRKWIDNSYTKDLEKVVTAMKKSQIGGETLEELIDRKESEKKK